MESYTNFHGEETPYPHCLMKAPKESSSAWHPLTACRRRKPCSQFGPITNHQEPGELGDDERNESLANVRQLDLRGSNPLRSRSAKPTSGVKKGV